MSNIVFKWGSEHRSLKLGLAALAHGLDLAHKESESGPWQLGGSAACCSLGHKGGVSRSYPLPHSIYFFSSGQDPKVDISSVLPPVLFCLFLLQDLITVQPSLLFSYSAAEFKTFHCR